MTGQAQSPRLSKIIAATVVLTVAAMVGYANWKDAVGSRNRFTIAPLIGTPGAPRTSREELAGRIAQLKARLATRPDDTGAAVLLADALMRQARVTGNGGLTLEAEQALRGALKEDPADYDALRMLGTVYLSQHRFREAIQDAERARDIRPYDAWNYGVIGDGYIELGEYSRAFDAFDAMVSRRPGSAAYARVAYARELQGNLEGALRAMKMAAEATAPDDPEAQAWHHAQVGDLYFQVGRIAEAQREYERAALIFPDHPFAVAGLAKVKAARGDYAGALELYRAQLERTPTLDLAAEVGDLYARRGNVAEAERYYAMAENIARESVGQSESTLARFWAERGRRLEQAVRLAESVAAIRHDIFTEDALAWAYFKVGRRDEARAASDLALRTGTRDRRILYHAAAIRHAAGDVAGARELLERALAGNLEFDQNSAPAARQLLESLSRRRESTLEAPVLSARGWGPRAH